MSMLDIISAAIDNGMYADLTRPQTPRDFGRDLINTAICLGQWFRFDFKPMQEVMDYGSDLLVHDLLPVAADVTAFEFPMTTMDEQGKTDGSTHLVVCGQVFNLADLKDIVSRVRERLPEATGGLARWSEIAGSDGRIVIACYSMIKHFDDGTQELTGHAIGMTPLTGNDGVTPKMFVWPGTLEEAKDDDERKRLTQDAQLAVGLYLTYSAALSIKEVRTHTDIPNQRLNRKREARGQRPLPTRHTVHLVVPGDATPIRHGGGGERSSPRHHFRRGHLRTLNRGKEDQMVVPVKPAWIGDPNIGEIIKAYSVHQKEPA